MSAPKQTLVDLSDTARVLVLLLGLAWLVAIYVMIEPLATILRAAYIDPRMVGPWPDVMLFAAAALPLACVHTRHPSALHVGLTHGGVFALTATISLFASPANPLFVDTPSHRSFDDAPWFGGPVLAWIVAAILGALAAVVMARLRTLANWRGPLMATIMGVLLLAQALFTVQVVSGGWLLMSTKFPWWSDATKLATGAAYAVIAAACMWGEPIMRAVSARRR